MSNNADYFGGMDGEANASPSDLKALTDKCREAIEQKAAIDAIEADLKAAKATFHHLNTAIIPDMMAEVGVTELVADGWKITSNEIVSGSLPKSTEERAAAIKYLVENEAGDLIKIDVKTKFGRGQREEAERIAGLIDGEGFPTNIDEGVHPQTLSAWARERMKNGEPVDTEILGLYTGKVAKYKEVK